ncbi:MAG: hypothetical protein DHS20C13_05810 [Thermodesulfobacteriota bacterium]|nr:MAG: hypothetical protein DHS20C13_05810 [Thermodesulfobacteriota bacterium]
MSETQQTRVVAIVDDIFFASKIREAAKSAQVNIEIFKNPDGIIESLTNAVFTLIIVDLDSKKFNSLKIIEKLKTREDAKDISTLGYLSHVQENLKNEAIKAGYDSVMPRSRFSRELISILKKHLVHK